jgi:AcrR family transcriptional regulator
MKRMRKLLRDAVIELVEERGFDALTVGEITERAMVSRAAFYRHYQDKRDLVEQIFDEAMGSMLSTVGNWGQEHPPDVLVAFFDHIAHYDRLYRALLGSNGSPWFVRKMRASLVELVRQHERGAVPDRRHSADWPVMTFSDSFVPEVVSAMLVEAITWWLDHGRPYSPTEMATRCARLVSACFREVSMWS